MRLDRRVCDARHISIAGSCAPQGMITTVFSQDPGPASITPGSTMF